MRRNFFIFLTRASNFREYMKRLLYGADVSRNDQRSLGNVKPGDLALIWVPDDKLLYGVFEVQDRVFYDETDIGCTGVWSYRCRLKLWDGYLRFVPDQFKAKLMSFVSRELVTLTDLTNLGGYIHSLLYDEGAKLLDFFLANSEARPPTSVVPDFGTQVAPPLAAKDFSLGLSRASKLAEYELEMYLLQRLDKLEEVVGSGVSEVYNMLFGYQRRYLDIMTVHRDEDNRPFKTTILELKMDLNQSKIETALDELSSYMFWISDQIKKQRISGSPDSIFGILVTPQSSKDLKDLFISRRKFYAGQYGIEANKLHYVSFDLKEKEASFTFEI